MIVVLDDEDEDEIVGGKGTQENPAQNKGGVKGASSEVTSNSHYFMGGRDTTAGAHEDDNCSLKSLGEDL